MRDYILFVTRNWHHPHETGSTGGTISNYFLFKHLSKRFRIVVLVIGPQDPPPSGDCENIKIIHSPPPSWRGLQLVSNWIPFIDHQLVSLRDVLGLPSAVFSTTSTVSAVNFSSLNKIPSAIIVQAFENFGFFAPSVSASTRLSLVKQAMIRRFTDRRHFNSATVILSNSRYMSNMVAKRFHLSLKKIMVVPQLCDIHFNSLQSTNTKTTVGFVNRNTEKNQRFIFALARRLPDLKFIVFGSPIACDEKPVLNLKFMGWESDRNKMFAQAALWLIPSRWPEPFGRVSIEAQAAGRRVLAAAVGGLPETVEDPRFLISGYDLNTWVERIENLLALPDESLIENAARIRQRFSQESHDRAADEVLLRLAHAEQELSDARGAAE
jgi:glycosyltransferase involved in cell wall biosynthesis